MASTGSPPDATKPHRRRSRTPSCCSLLVGVVEPALPCSSAFRGRFFCARLVTSSGETPRTRCAGQAGERTKKCFQGATLSEQEATGAADNAPVSESTESEPAAPAQQPGGAAVATATGSESEDSPVVLDDLGGQSFSDAVDATIVEFDDGDIVSGKVVKIDSDEVLRDIGYKSQGVIPARELSIRNDIDPNEVVQLGEELEALVLQKEDKDGRLIL